MDRRELLELAKSETVLQAASPEEALNEAAKQFGLPTQDLAVEPMDEGRFRVRILKRDGAFLLQLAPDGMNATLVYVLPPLGAGAAVTSQAVLERLQSMGVTHGVREEAVAQAIAQVQVSGQPGTAVIVAEAVPAAAGQDAQLEFTPPEIAEGLGKDQPRRYLVRKGQAFGHKRALTMGRPGFTILGHEIPATAGRDLTPKPAEEIELGKDGVLHARQSGFLRLTGPVPGRPQDELRLEPAVQVAPDKLQASLSLYPALPPSPPYRPALILELLSEHGVVEGIRHKDLEKICHYVNRQQKPAIRVRVAEGRRPVPGTDGRVEYAVETRPQAGALLSDGRMDFRQRGFLRGVKAGQVVARRMPAGPGQPGRTVLGEELPAQGGQEIALSAGENIEVSADGSAFHAARDGVLLISSSRELSVVELYEHSGDVDYSVGNLDIEGSLSVSGSVRPGFSLKAKGDILIGDTLEAAQVEAGGSVAVGRGVVGKGKCRVRAGNQIKALYAEGATLIAREGIEIADSLLYCDVFCGTELVVTQRTGRIAGGTCVVAGRICAKEVGTEAGAKTRLVLGLSREQYMESLDLQGQIEAIRQEATRPGTDPRTQDRYMKLVEGLKERLEEQQAKYSAGFSGVRVEILGRIFPPTEIVFRLHSSVVREPLKGVVFFFDDVTRTVIHRPLS